MVLFRLVRCAYMPLVQYTLLKFLVAWFSDRLLFSAGGIDHAQWVDQLRSLHWEILASSTILTHLNGMIKRAGPEFAPDLAECACLGVSHFHWLPNTFAQSVHDSRGQDRLHALY